ncbi:hypothetical protein 8G_00007 [Ralstonia phage Hyacinthe]|uniref:Scaffolding protein n=1 Tax=Ralstonia phage Hyacinthe TaxID=2759731 RepID=A0A7G5BAW6_9CAUD|nr:hypothetical protein 8G_00007 [Ralstonia phage Hyacinthe]
MADPDPNPNPNPNPNPAPPTPPREPETFSKEYVRELREENKGYRLKAQEMERKAQEAEDRARKAAEEGEAKGKEAETKAEQRVIRAELKALAIKAGMVDLDGLKLADLSAVKLNPETGEVEGAEALMESLKKSKPYLFGAAHSSTPGNPPNPKTSEAKKATEMTDEEYKAARAGAIRGAK